MATIHPNFSTPVTTLSTNVPTTLTDSESTTTNSNAPQAKIDNLTISGKALMLSRLFHTDDIYVTPKIEYSTTTRNTSGLVYNFLTASDRGILARIYEYASNNGTDLDQVDHLAFDLACYRMAGASGGNRDTTGMITDNEGRVLISHFSQEDTAAAKRILTSDAMKDTAIDGEFLLTLMNPGKKPTHATDFDFLEEIVVAFSSPGGTDPKNESGGLPKPVSADVAVVLARLDYQPDDDELKRLKEQFGDTRSTLGQVAIVQEKLREEYQELILEHLNITDLKQLANAFGVALLKPTSERLSFQLNIIRRTLFNDSEK